MQKAKAGVTGSWAKGPAEAWAFAVGLSQGTDRERRMAMLLCDNAVEIALKTYLGLRPGLRGGPPIEWKGDPGFHDLWEGYEQCFDEWPDGVSRDELRWLHDIRNQLHHKGNGLAPDSHVLDTYLKVGKALLDHLYGTEAASTALAEQALPAEAAPPDPTIDSRPPVLKDLDDAIAGMETLMAELPDGAPGELARPPGSLAAAIAAEDYIFDRGMDFDEFQQESSADFILDEWTFSIDGLPANPVKALELLRRLRYLLLFATF